MNISSSSSYTGTNSPGYPSATNHDSTSKSAHNSSLSNTDSDTPSTTISAPEKSPQEQQLDETKQYKKEDQQKELKKKEADQLFEKQQQHQEEMDKLAYEMLTNQGIAQIGATSQLALNKDNYEETVKHLVAKGFQMDADEQKLTIRSELHQLKLEISKQSYNQYVKTVYGKEIAAQYTDTDSSLPTSTKDSSLSPEKTTPVSPTSTPISDSTPPTNHSNPSHLSNNEPTSNESSSNTTNANNHSTNNNGNTISSILPGGLVK